MVSGGNFVVIGSSEINLGSRDNLIERLGGLSSTGAITLSNGQALALNGTISAGGAIILTASSLSLTANIASSGGAVTLRLGDGLYSNGTGFSWTTGGQNLYLDSTVAPTIIGTAL